MKTYESVEPIHSFFGLSYASYLSIPRSVLQSMPVEWQKQFVACLEELDEQFSWRRDGLYTVLKNRRGQFMFDFFADYDRGRRILTKEEISHISKEHKKWYACDKESVIYNSAPKTS